jgi:hypothetical protein
MRSLVRMSANHHAEMTVDHAKRVSEYALRWSSRRRTGHIHSPVDALHVERDESGWHLRRGRKCTGAEVQRAEGAVEGVDAA